MPKKPLKSKRRATIDITWQQVLALISSDLLSRMFFRDKEQRGEAWQNNKKAIMALQGKPLEVKEYPAIQKVLKRKVWFDFFERPKAFFEYDRGEVFAGCTKDTTLSFKDYLTLPFGLSGYCSPEEREVYDLFGCQYPRAENAIIYEDQKEYLIKNNLLNSREKAILRAEEAK